MDAEIIIMISQDFVEIGSKKSFHDTSSSSSLIKRLTELLSIGGKMSKAMALGTSCETLEINLTIIQKQHCLLSPEPPGQTVNSDQVDVNYGLCKIKRLNGIKKYFMNCPLRCHY